MIQLMSLVGPCIGALSGVGIASKIFKFRDSRFDEFQQEENQKPEREFDIYKIEVPFSEAMEFCNKYKEKCFIRFASRAFDSYNYKSNFDSKMCTASFYVFLEKDLVARLKLEDRIDNLEKGMPKKKGR